MALDGQIDQETGIVDIWECGNYFDYTYCDGPDVSKTKKLNKQFECLLEDIREFGRQRNKSGVAKFCLESKIISKLKSNRNLMYLCEISPYLSSNKNDDCWSSNTIAYESLNSGLLGVVEFVLNDDKGACVPCGVNRSTLSMECIRRGYEGLANISTRNDKARVQVDKFGQNSGMVAIDHFFRTGQCANIISEYLKYNDCATQQRMVDGRNMGGMLAAMSVDTEDKLSKHIECLNLAFENDNARNQLDKDGNNMLEILRNHLRLRSRIVICGADEDIMRVFRHTNNRYQRLISLYDQKYNQENEMND